ncbi:MAG: hypothetical protein AAFR35_15475 [Pseudomonadota bacterium]
MAPLIDVVLRALVLFVPLAVAALAARRFVLSESGNRILYGLAGVAALAASSATAQAALGPGALGARDLGTALAAALAWAAIRDVTAHPRPGRYGHGTRIVFQRRLTEKSLQSDPSEHS